MGTLPYITLDYSDTLRNASARVMPSERSPPSNVLRLSVIVSECYSVADAGVGWGSGTVGNGMPVGYGPAVGGAGVNIGSVSNPKLARYPVTASRTTTIFVNVVDALGVGVSGIPGGHRSLILVPLMLMYQ